MLVDIEILEINILKWGKKMRNVDEHVAIHVNSLLK